MNILFIHHVPDMYGSSRCLLRMADKLARDGHCVAATLQEDGPLRNELEKAGTKVFLVREIPALHRSRLARPTAWFGMLRDVMLSRRRIKQIFAEFKPDLVHTNSATLLPVAGSIAHAAGIPHILHVRESFLDFGLLWKIYRMVLVFYADKIIAISGFIAGTFSARQQQAKVVTIYDGLPEQDFINISPPAVESFIEKYKLKRPLIALVGRIKLKRKGQDVLVNAAAILKHKFPDATYAMVGSPFPGNEDHLDNLKSMIREPGLEDRIVLTGHLDQPLVALAACDISIMASSTPEPLGNVTIESMALGKPVVGTNLGGTPELVQDRKTGLLIPPGDAEAMANALAYLLEHPEEAARMGQLGRERYLNEFTFDQYYEKLAQLYENSMVKT
ncbi:MAG TPA: glycosyltransferase family 4 protein [Kiritimatiellia bacterium]|nr:glycosyltransferase family 4 protein [Kiritimatiellia bacterium]